MPRFVDRKAMARGLASSLNQNAFEQLNRVVRAKDAPVNHGMVSLETDPPNRLKTSV
jgi:hypothetical protein